MLVLNFFSNIFFHRRSRGRPGERPPFPGTRQDWLGLRNVTNSTESPERLEAFHIFLRNEESYDLKMLTYAIFQPVFTFIVIPMNVLLIWAFVRGGFRSPSHVVLIAIAMFNNLHLLSISIPSFYFFVFQHGKEYVLYSWCIPYMILMYRIPKICSTLSLYLTVLLGLHRYLIVTFPIQVHSLLKNRQTVLLVIALTALATLCDLGYILTLSDIQAINTESHLTQGQNITSCAWLKKPTITIRVVLVDTMATFLPIGLLIVLNVMLISVIIRQNHGIGKSRRSNADQDTRRMVIITTSILSSVILVSVPDVIIKQVLFVKGRPCDGCFLSKSTLALIMHFVTNITYSANFLIYSCLSKKFRQQLKKIFQIRPDTPAFSNESKISYVRKSFRIHNTAK